MSQARYNLEEYKARLRALAGEAVATSDVNSGALNADHNKLAKTINREETQVDYESRAASANTVGNTLDAAQANRQKEIEQLYACSVNNAEENVELRAQLNTMKAALDELKERRVQYGAAGNAVRSAEDLNDLIRTPSTDPRVVELKKRNDVAFFARHIIERYNLHNPVNRVDYRQHPAHKALQMATRALYSTGSSAGDEFVPTVMSSDIMMKYDMDRVVSKIIPSFQLPRGEAQTVYISTNPTVYKQSERTQDPGADYKASQLVPAQIDFVPVTNACLTYWSAELDERSIAAQAQINSDAMMQEFAIIMDDLVINGDTDMSLDTGESYASDDYRRSWDGLRTLCQSGTKVDLGTWAVTTLMGIRAAMGKYGARSDDLAMLVSLNAYYRKIVASSDFQAYNLAPGQLPVVTGSVGRYFGMDVIPTDKCRDDLNASGIYDGVTETKGCLVIVNKKMYRMGEARTLGIKTDEDIKSGQFVMVATMRNVMRKMAASTDLTEGYGYNI